MTAPISPPPAPTNDVATAAVAPFEIQDPEVDTEALMRLIRERIRQRSNDALAHGQRYGLPAGLNNARKLSAEVYQSLDQARNAASNIRVPLVVTGGGISTVPVVGPLVQKVRRALHQVSLFYINLLADRQIVFNRASTDSLRRLTIALDQATARIETLEREMAALRDQLPSPVASPVASPVPSPEPGPSGSQTTTEA